MAEMNLFSQEATAVADSTVAQPWFSQPIYGGVSDVAVAGLRVFILIAGAYVLIRFIDRLAQASIRRFDDLPQGTPRKQRANTMAALFSSFARYLLWPVALILVLGEFGFNLSAIIATAGIAGIALGFGAQTLVKDVIAGFFLLFDDTVHVGDVITVGTQTGLIEDIGLRLLKMRRLDGELVMIPAGELRIFGNRSIGFARIAVEIDVSYEQDVQLLTDELQKVTDEWTESHRDILMDEEPEVHSVLRLTDSTVKLRVIAKVRPGEQWLAERDLLKLVKIRFDERGIEFPFPRRTVYLRNENQEPAS